MYFFTLCEKNLHSTQEKNKIIISIFDIIILITFKIEILNNFKYGLS